MSTNDDVAFGEPAESFEALPPKPAVQALPSDAVELAYLSAVLGDPDGGLFAHGRNLPSAAFGHAEARAIWSALGAGIRPDDVLGLVRETRIPIERILELSQLDRMGTMASVHLAELWRRHRQRAKLALARRIADSADLDPEEWKREIDALASGNATPTATKGLSAFAIPPLGDRSILLGNRYLNRGDGGVISSTSGVGKSSMSLQAATCWALGRDFFGIKPNGHLKSLIVQSEDSEGDVAEVWFSIRHKLKLTEAEAAAVEARVIIAPDRVHRGANFIANLRTLIRLHRPDLVWINPLQAYIDGDVTDAKDLGLFLREGLNGLNEPPEFGIILVHHTTKPAAPSAKTEERKWSETMYDMAGGAEIINWARFIISLRATEEEGKFNLILAKRGRRAGVTKQVEQGAGFRDEITTTVAIQHAREQIDLPERKDKLSVIFWEPSEHDPKPKKQGKNPYGPTLEEILPAFRVPKEKALTMSQAIRAICAIRRMTPTQASNFVAEAVATGRVIRSGDDREPVYSLA